ncbi:MAG: hypothetical protein IKS19_02290 [Clostridia bacterium]|nr:hypothetical protein [Clostridia bacterium]
MKITFEPYQPRKKKRGTFGLIVDVILTICTCGLWLLWLLIKFLRNNS